VRLIDISGQTFGRLTVISKHTEPSKNGGSLWSCLCSCGASVIVNASNLRNGSTQSCGCLAVEWSSKMGADKGFIARRSTTIQKHGHKRKSRASVEYKTWLAMKRRCYAQKCKDFPNWGGRGIIVCDRWKFSFENFLADMGLRPEGQYSIDRIDPNGNYEPSNCRWATPVEQGAEHCRSNIPVVVDGIEYPSLKAACRSYGVPFSRTHSRFSSGYSVDEAIKARPYNLSRKRTRESYLRNSA
jgi:hypothetical protein